MQSVLPVVAASNSFCSCEACREVCLSLSGFQEESSYEEKCRRIESQILQFKDRYCTDASGSMNMILSRRLVKVLSSARTIRAGVQHVEDIPILENIKKSFYKSLVSVWLLNQQENIIARLPLYASGRLDSFKKTFADFQQKNQFLKIQLSLISCSKWSEAIISNDALWSRFLVAHEPLLRECVEASVSSFDSEDRERLKVVLHVVTTFLDYLPEGEAKLFWQHKANFLEQVVQTPPLGPKCPLEIVVSPSESKKQVEKRFRCLESTEALGKGTYKIVSKIVLQRIFPSEKAARCYAFSKLLRFERDTEIDFEREATISKMLREKEIPYILNVKKIVYTRPAEIQNVGLLSEYCSIGTLDRFLEKERSLLVRMILAEQICTALQAMHEDHFCHLDLKLANIFITSSAQGIEIRIGDLSNISKEGELVEHCSTLASPEMMLDPGEFVTAKVSMDLWALGEILLVLKKRKNFLVRENILCQTPYHEFAQKVKNVSERLQKYFREPLDDIDRRIIQLFSFNPEERPSAGMLAEVLRSTYGIQRE